MTQGSSEERFRAMADAMPQIVWVTDNEGRAKFFNKRWGEYTGVWTDPLPAADLLVQCIHPEDREATVEAYRKAQRKGTTFEVEHRLRANDGSYRWFLARAEPYRDPQSGEIQSWFGATTDIHDRKLADAALRESESRYRWLFDSIDQGFCIIEVLFDMDDQPSDYRFVEVNPAFEAQTGLVNAVGRRVRELVPGHEQFWMETYGRIARSGIPERFEHRADALGRWYEVYAFPVGDPKQRHLAVLFNDVWPRKMAEEQLRDSETRFRALVTASSYVVYRMSPDWAEMWQLDGHGFLLDTQQPSPNWLEEYIHPDDQLQVKTGD